ncbi:MAG: TlpA family protein disulfide reductase [Methylococcales bacterium]
MINIKTIPFGVLLLLVTFARTTASDIGQNAPDCKLSAFSDRRAVDLSQYRGEVLYVDFWASWCPPCAKSFNFLNSVHEEFRPRGLKILGINMDEESGDARAFLKDYPAEFDVLADDNASCAKLFDVKAMPSSYLIDRNGVIRHVHMGFRSDETEQIKQMIQQLLAENHSKSLGDSYSYVNPNQ